jgi:hypothetical protein
MNTNIYVRKMAMYLTSAVPFVVDRYGTVRKVSVPDLDQPAS